MAPPPTPPTPPTSPAAGPADAVAWLVELARTFPGLLPGAVDLGTRQRVLVAVSDEHGSRWRTYVHGAWRDFRGAAAAVDAEVTVIDFARASARARRPLDPTALDVTLPPAAVKAVRATIAAGELAGLATAALDRVVDRLAPRAPAPAEHPGGARDAVRRPVATVVDGALAALAAPVATAAVAAATGARLAHRLAPPPTIDTPPPAEMNLLTHVVAKALEAWLANAGVRLVLLRLPFTVTIALRDGRSECTVGLGQNRASVRNGVDPHALVLLEGGLRPVLRAATGNVLDQLGHLRVRRV